MVTIKTNSIEMVDSTTFLLSCTKQVKMHDKSRTNSGKSRRLTCPFKERSKTFYISHRFNFFKAFILLQEKKQNKSNFTKFALIFLLLQVPYLESSGKTKYQSCQSQNISFPSHSENLEENESIFADTIFSYLWILFSIVACPELEKLLLFDS